MRFPYWPMTWLRGAFRGILIAVILAGCANYGQLDEQDARALLQQDKTIILMRLTAENDGKLYDAISSFTGVDAYGVNLVDLRTGEQKSIGPRFLSPNPQAREDGWIWFDAVPGDYFVQVFAPIGSSTERQARLWSDNRFRFSVTKPGGIQYIGSFHVTCTSTWSLMGRIVGDCPGQLEITDENALARAVSARSFGQTAVVTAGQVRPYAEAPSPDELHAAAPIAVAVTMGSPWQSPDWKRLRDRSAPIPPGGGGFGGGGGCYGPGCGALAFVVISIWAGAAIVDAAMDDQMRRNWEPCIARIERSLPEWGLPERLHDYLAREATPGGLIRTESATALSGAAPGTATDKFDSLLQLDLQRVQLRKCREPNAVSTEVAVRAHLTDRRSGRITYDSTVVYSSPEAVPTGGYEQPQVGYPPLPPHSVWEAPAEASAQCRSIEAFCTGDGLGLFRSELEKGLRSIAETIAHDLALGEPIRRPSR